ncbi:MAG: DUF1624 domain-containing protein [Clostridiales bacterium]|jgi:uncharacterized membrane protein|nr:DUF1624 domain-containing protein [Clostridiales bacterium]
MNQDLSYKNKRIWELDFLRGFCILLMIIDHTFYDLAFIFQGEWFGSLEGEGFLYLLTDFSKSVFFPSLGRKIIRPVAVFCFIFISGISCSFSHSNFKRGLRLAAVALVLTVATYGLDFLMQQENQLIIRFGILHLLAVSILIYCLLRRFGKIAMALIGILAIILGTYYLYNPLETNISYMAILVKSTTNFYSADYFPILPFIGYFLIGAALGPLLYKHRTSLFPIDNLNRIRPVLFFGRNALIVYLIHQPVIYAILYLIGWIFLTNAR